MTTTFKKRQKEMKRMDKARMKAERRAQKKLTEKPGEGVVDDNIAWDEEVVPGGANLLPDEPDTQPGS